MSLYEKNPVVVIDDSIYDHIGDYKKIFCKKEFGSTPEKVKFIKLSQVNDFITAKNIDSHSVYFYIFEKIDTAEEYVSACDKIVKSNNVDIVKLFGQYSGSFDVCGCAYSGEQCNIHTVSVNYSFGFDQEMLDPENERYRNCLHLISMLLYLLSFEEGAFDDFSVKLKLNYPSMYCAVQRNLFEIKDEINNIKKQIDEKRSKIEALGSEKPHKYSMLFTYKDEEADNPPPVPDGDYEKSLSSLSSYYLTSKEQFDNKVSADVNFTRYTMAEMDEFAQGGPKPEVYQRRSEATDKVADVDELLRRVSDGDENRINIKLAISLARNLVDTKKPDAGPFITAGAVALVLFVITVATVYAAHIIKNTAASVDMELLAVCIGVPAAIIVVSVLVGFIANVLAFSSVKRIIKGLYSAVRKKTSEFSSVSEKIRCYLNDFITVFCNNHIKDSIISQCRKQLAILEKNKETTLEKVVPLNYTADLLHMLYEYEKQNDNFAHNESDVDSMYTSEESFVGYDETEPFENQFYSQPTADDSSDAAEEAKMKTYINKNACLEAISDNSQTDVVGSDNSSFINSKSPWILKVDISKCSNGGVL